MVPPTELGCWGLDLAAGYLVGDEVQTPGRCIFHQLSCDMLYSSFSESALPLTQRVAYSSRLHRLY